MSAAFFLLRLKETSPFPGPYNNGMRIRSRPAARALALALLAAAPGVTASDPSRPFLVPLDDAANWQVLQFRSLPPHRIRFSKGGLEMVVEASAMPVIYPLPIQMTVSTVRVRGRIEGTLRVPPERQGEARFDDYSFRIGLVETGKRTLNVFERQFAAAWVRKLFDLASKGGGISHIHFFNLGTDRSQIGRERQHPLSDLILEKVVAVPGPDGRFELVHDLDAPLQTLAVWLSSDGDDSGSKFTVLVEEIELRPAPRGMSK
jgi:hypothetical protein